MDELGRYYTSNIISKLLINNIECIKPKRVLDLGIGNASLTLAAFTRWSQAEYFATEFDYDKVLSIGAENRLNFINVFQYDTLHPEASDELRTILGSNVDIAICNPPYLKVENKERYYNLFKSISCDDFCKLSRITSEIVFFAHNIKLLTKNGELGIIVSDSLVTGKEFKLFRSTIFEQFDVRRIIQLPDKIFNKTEARTHIIFIRKSKTSNTTCELFSSNIHGIISKGLIVPNNLLIERMDFQFHIANVHSNTLHKKTIKQVGGIIRRGKFSYKELRESVLPFFHSVHFKENNVHIGFKDHVPDEYQNCSASEGDILMCRVGKRVVGKVAIVKSGRVLHSDCIYRITVPQKYRQVLLKSLRSKEGKEWLQAYAHGVCSQVISKSDLENFPLYKLK